MGGEILTTFFSLPRATFSRARPPFFCAYGSVGNFNHFFRGCRGDAARAKSAALTGDRPLGPHELALRDWDEANQAEWVASFFSWQMLTTWLRDVVDALWSCVTPAPDGHVHVTVCPRKLPTLYFT